MDLWSDFQTYLQKLAMKILKRNKRGGVQIKVVGFILQKILIFDF